MRISVAILLTLSAQGLCAELSREATKKRADALVRQLGHPEWVKREQAIQDLIKLGEPSLPALREALRSVKNDLEVLRRSRVAITKILKGLRTKNSLGMEMSHVPAGRFTMGSPQSEAGRRSDEVPHRVRITEYFLLGKYEVTQTEFYKLMGFNPSGFWNFGEGKKRVPRAGKQRYPVENVTWFDALEFCNRLSKKDGYDCYYQLTNVKLKDKSIVGATVKIQGGNGYRLPTEAEWEHACRAGSSMPFYFGIRNTGKQSNIKASYRTGGYGTRYKAWKDLSKTTYIGRYPANEWRLHDMLGNVAEWVQDYYSPLYYRASPKKDPTGPETGRHRVIRGGSWLVTEKDARSASRFYQTPDERKNYVGFRVARTP